MGQGVVSWKRVRQREERGDSAAAQIGDFLGESVIVGFVGCVGFALAYGTHDGHDALASVAGLAHAPAPQGTIRDARDQEAVAARRRLDAREAQYVPREDSSRPDIRDGASRISARRAAAVVLVERETVLPHAHDVARGAEAPRIPRHRRRRRVLRQSLRARIRRSSRSRALHLARRLADGRERSHPSGMVRDGARELLQVGIHREPHFHLPTVRPREQPLVVHGEAPPGRVVVAEGRIANELDPVAASALLDMPRGDGAVHGRADEPGKSRVGVGVVHCGERQHRAGVRVGDTRHDGKSDVRVVAPFTGNASGDDVPRSKHACPTASRPRGTR